MKLKELTAQALSLSLEEKENLHMVLSYSIKVEGQVQTLVQQELDDASQVTAVLISQEPVLQSKLARKADSTCSIISNKLLEGEATQEELLSLLQEKRNWTRAQAVNNLSANKSRLEEYGFKSRGYGKQRVWYCNQTADKQAA